NHDLSVQCYNRANWLRTNARGSAPAGYQPGRPSEARYTGYESRLYPVAAGSAPTATLSAPCVPRPPQPTMRGHLRLAGRCVDCRRTYVLESSQGQVLTYVTALPGVDLEQHVNRNVELTGPVCWRGDVRANYMTASRAAPLP